MITQYFLAIITAFFIKVLSLFSLAKTLPTIAGVDIDSVLVTGLGEARIFFGTFWIFTIMLQGMVVLLVYYGIKMIAKLLLGSRVPTHG